MNEGESLYADALQEEVWRLRRILAALEPLLPEHRQDVAKELTALQIEYNKAITETIPGLVMDRDRVEKDYYELIFAVASKYPGETRHQTALKYIRQAEEREDFGIAKRLI